MSEELHKLKNAFKSAADASVECSEKENDVYDIFSQIGTAASSDSEIDEYLFEKYNTALDEFENSLNKFENNVNGFMSVLESYDLGEIPIDDDQSLIIQESKANFPQLVELYNELHNKYAKLDSETSDDEINQLAQDVHSIHGNATDKLNYMSNMYTDGHLEQLKHVDMKMNADFKQKLKAAFKSGFSAGYEEFKKKSIKGKILYIIFLLISFVFLFHLITFQFADALLFGVLAFIVIPVLNRLL